MGHIEKRKINQSLLKSYRLIFISMQLLLLIAGTIVLFKSSLILYIISGIALIVIWWVWVPVVSSRHRLIDFNKYMAEASDDLKNRIRKICPEGETGYVHNKSIREKVNELFGLESNWRETRRKIDIWLPVLFSIAWLTLAGYQVCLQFITI